MTCTIVPLKLFSTVLAHVTFNHFVQIETLDLVNKPAPLAPELAMKEDLHGKERQKQLKTDKV